MSAPDHWVEGIVNHAPEETCYCIECPRCEAFFDCMGPSNTIEHDDWSVSFVCRDCARDPALETWRRMTSADALEAAECDDAPSCDYLEALAQTTQPVGDA